MRNNLKKTEGVKKEILECAEISMQHVCISAGSELTAKEVYFSYISRQVD
jgi:hypothetical protein